VEQSKEILQTGIQKPVIKVMQLAQSAQPAFVKAMAGKASTTLINVLQKNLTLILLYRNFNGQVIN
jgi:hypothetical protein